MSRGGWMQTYTGRKFHPFDPKPEEIVIEDIAHALASLCRFAGHTRIFYSVANHSVLVARHCPASLALAGLLHDAAEAYLIDLPAPVKNDPSMSNYRLLDVKLQSVIYKAFEVDVSRDLTGGMPREVALVDSRMLATEVRDLLGPPPEPWVWLPEPYPETILPMSVEGSEKAFLDLFEKLGGKNPW